MASKGIPNWIWNIIIMVLGPLFSLVTPMIKGELTEFVQNLYEKAKGTDNPVDDAFVKMLAALLDITLAE